MTFIIVSSATQKLVRMVFSRASKAMRPKKVWRSRVSIPVPPACKAGALPFELHPHRTPEQAGKYPTVWVQDHGVKSKLRQPGVEPGAKAWEASMLPIHHWRTSKRVWRSRVSIPVPADCEPTALPSELHPRDRFGRAKSEVQAMGFEPMPLAGLAPKASALTTRPNLRLHYYPVRRVRRPKKRLFYKSLGGLEPPTPRSEV